MSALKELDPVRDYELQAALSIEALEALADCAIVGPVGEIPTVEDAAGEVTSTARVIIFKNN